MLRRMVSTAVIGAMALGVACSEHIQPKIRSGEVPSYAVNLGGWLLGEAWMSYTSPMWKDVPQEWMYHGEYAVMQALGKEKGTAAFQEHWASWIVEEDFKKIADAGLNTVRVPIGFWIINDDPAENALSSNISKVYARGGLKFLDKVVNDWAVKYNLAVMISLHAHQGSQNGLEHSAPQVFGNATWYKSPENVESSFRFATFIAKRYNQSESFLGMTLMNEPGWGQDYNVLLKYYSDAYKAIRATGNNCILVTAPWISDQKAPHMMDFMTCPEYFNVWHEFHIYYKWGWENSSRDDIFSFANNYGMSHLRKWQGDPLYVSEWSLATDETVPLTRAQFKQLGDIQLTTMQAAPSGWAFWAWRHSDDEKMLSGWSLRQMLEEKLITIPKVEPNKLKNGKTYTQRCLANDSLWEDWFDNSSEWIRVTAVNEKDSKIDNGTIVNNAKNVTGATTSLAPPRHINALSVAAFALAVIACVL